MALPVFKPRFDNDLMRPYWDALAEGHIALPACTKCGAWQWYPLEIPRCHPDAQFQWKTVSSTGTVFVATTVYRCLLPGDHKADAPYTNALVELDGVKGPRLVGLLEGFDDLESAAGARVKLKPTERRWSHSPRSFVPALEI